MNLNEPQRISIKIKCPNPLFQQWLIEWREKAAAKGTIVNIYHTLNI